MGPQNGRRRQAVRLTAALVALAALGVVAAGCGGGSPSAGVAQLGTTTGATTTGSGPAAEGTLGSGGSGPSTATGGGQARIRIAGGTQKQGLRFAQCMRAHGVPSFPDPSSDGSFSFSGNPKQMAGFQTASQACRKLLPKGKPPSPAEQAAMRKQALKFSSCMRSHGFPQFPDPVFTDGGIQIRLNKNAGMDPSSPAFQRAQQACQSFMPGKVGAK
jgi:hypothetical protein